MKRLLLIALMASGLAFVPVQRSDAQVSVGVGGVGVGFGYGPMAIITAPGTTGIMGIMGIGFTATIGIITTIAIKLA